MASRSRDRSGGPPRSPAGTKTAQRLRLQRILADAGLASRRSAETLIRAGRVTVNGSVASLGDSADPRLDSVALDGRSVRSERVRYWMLNKPRGVLTTLSDPHGRRTVRELLPPAAGPVVPVGRLDLETEGLLLLTNDGQLAQVLLHPSHQTQREYQLSVRGDLSRQLQRRLERGIELDGKRTAPMQVARARYDRRADLTRLHLTLVEGRKRQIRRSLRVLGHPVTRLQRVRMGPLVLGRLLPGRARELRADELRALRRHVEEHQRSPRRRGRPQRRPGSKSDRRSDR